MHLQHRLTRLYTARLKATYTRSSYTGRRQAARRKATGAVVIGARLGHELSDGEDKQHAGHASVDERDLGLVPG